MCDWCGGQLAGKECTGAGCVLCATHAQRHVPLCSLASRFTHQHVHAQQEDTTTQSLHNDLLSTAAAAAPPKMLLAAHMAACFTHHTHHTQSTVPEPCPHL
jgi:hypothetical protein